MNSLIWPRPFPCSPSAVLLEVCLIYKGSKQFNISTKINRSREIILQVLLSGFWQSSHGLAALCQEGRATELGLFVRLSKTQDRNASNEHSIWWFCTVCQSDDNSSVIFLRQKISWTKIFGGSTVSNEVLYIL